jgi:hypothetical protein
LISLFLCQKKIKKIPPLGKKDIGSIMLLKCDELNSCMFGNVVAVIF